MIIIAAIVIVGVFNFLLARAMSKRNRLLIEEGRKEILAGELYITALAKALSEGTPIPERHTWKINGQ